MQISAKPSCAVFLATASPTSLNETHPNPKPLRGRLLFL